MLELVRISGGISAALASPRIAPPAVAGLQHGFADIGFAARANREFADQRIAAGHLPAEAEHLDAVGVRVFHGVMIKNVAVVLAAAHQPSAHADGRRRMSAHDPIADVEVVHVLLDDVVAAEPVEEVPVANLVLHFGERAAVHGPFDRAAVPIAPQHPHLADCAVAQPADGFQVLGVVMALQADADLQPLFVGQRAGRQHAAHARSVGGHRLFHEHVLAGGDGIFELLGPKPGRGA